MQEGLFQRRAQGEGCLAQVVQRIAHLLVRFQAHETGNGQRDLACYLAILNDDEPAVDVRKTVCGDRHIFIGCADHADIVAVMANGRGNRARLETETLHKAVGMVAVFPVTLDHRNFQDITLKIDGRLVTVDGRRKRRCSVMILPAARR